MNNDFKTRVKEAIIANGDRYPSAKKQAVALGINTAQLSRIKSGDIIQVISDHKWISIARKLDVQMKPGIQWKTARTPAFDFIYSQLADCQKHSISAILVDNTDLGKTHTAKVYVKKNANAIYVDCSQVKSKQLFVRKIAQEFGIDQRGRYVDVYEDLVFYLKTIENPLIILDEAGDLRMDAFLEIKALWNATERACGWYMMGADGLKAKMEKQRALKKVGFAEIFRRYGSRFQKVSPEGKADMDRFKRDQFALVAQANGLTEVQKLYARSGGSLERARIEFEKQQRANAQPEGKELAFEID